MRNRKRNLIGSFTVSKASKKKANAEFSGAGLEEGYSPLAKIPTPCA
jgi:hypothetical protein